ncbi:MAG TPA: hypothetical protein DCK87_01330 [Desulfotomaculum sp.]|nr:hypothetical protein [Desulfotomaculum sp.]
MIEKLCSGVVKDISILIKEINWSLNKCYMILERVPKSWLDKDQKGIIFQKFNYDFLFSTFEKGRIFDYDRELRWEITESGEFWVVYAGKDIILPELNSIPTEYLETSTSTYLLWGKKVTSEILKQLERNEKNLFIELQIPRILQYPVESETNKKTRVELKAFEYIDKETGQVIFSRFYDLEEV